jgi:glutathione S-transferase
MRSSEVWERALRARSGGVNPPPLTLDDGQVVFESTAIGLAIADRYPDAGLTGPLGSALRDQVYEWSIMAMTELERTTLACTESLLAT